MICYYIEKENKILFCDTNKENLLNTLTNTISPERRIWINPTGNKFMYPKPYTSTEYYKTEIITKPVNLVQVLNLVKERR